MKVRIDFIIDDRMAQCAIESLLSYRSKITKKSIFELCRNHLKAEGDLFVTEPYFSISSEGYDADESEQIFNKIWKNQR